MTTEIYIKCRTAFSISTSSFLQRKSRSTALVLPQKKHANKKTGNGAVTVEIRGFKSSGDRERSGVWFARI